MVVSPNVERESYGLRVLDCPVRRLQLDIEPQPGRSSGIIEDLDFSIYPIVRVL